MSNHLPSDNTSVEEREISLRDIIFIIQSYAKEVFQYWKKIALFCLPFISYFLYQAITFEKTYPAKLTFMVNEDEGGSMGGAMAILSSFGIGAGGGTSYNLEKVMELSKTRKIIHRTLFEKIVLDGKSDFIANHVIDIYELHEKWKKSEPLRTFKFDHDSISVFTRLQKTALKSLYVTVVGNSKTPGFYSTSLNDDSGVMSLKASTRDEQLTLNWLNLSFENLSHYYVEKSTEKQKATYNIVKIKVDSLQQALSRAEYNLANFKDSNRGIWAAKDRLSEQRLSREIQILILMYGEAIKNKEIAEFSLKSKTPFIQLIDPPLDPITPTMKSKMMAIILGVILGSFIATTFIVGRKIVLDSINPAN